jgi:hypothetical protein
LDPWQLERQVAYLLEAIVWEDAPQNDVLTGGAKVSADGVGNFAPGTFLGDGPVTLEPPFALVEVLADEHDAEAPARLDRVRVRVTVVAGGGGVAGWTGTTTTHDSHGIKTTIGGTRDPIQGQGKSTGRGLDEIVGRLREALGDEVRLVDSVHGLQGVLTVAGPILPVDGHQVLARELEIEVYTASVERFYHPIRRLKGTGGVGTIALTWKNAPARYDTLRNVVRRSAPGGPAPALATDGIDVPLAGALDESVSPAGLAAGTYAVSVFVAYDETTAIPTTADRHSDPVSFTGIVVT